MLFRKELFVVVLAALSTGYLKPVAAEEAPGNMEVQTLREKLQRSDAAIQRLSRRLEQVERDQEPKSAAPVERFAVDQASDSVKPTGYTEGLFDEKPSFEKRLDDMEKSWKKQEETNKKLSDADKKFPTLASPGATWKIGGRIHEDYWAFPNSDAGAAAFEGENPDDRFVFRRARLEFEGDILDNMMYRFQIELSNANSPEYRDMYFGFKDVPWFQSIVIGNQKRPYGLDHLNSSNANIFMERPFIVEAFNQDARRLGIAAYGQSEDEAWNWRYGVWNEWHCHS